MRAGFLEGVKTHFSKLVHGGFPYLKNNLEFKLEKNIGIQKHAGKVRKYCALCGSF